MAHPQETRKRLRRAYIFEQLSLEIASAQCGVAFPTARRWKKEALEAGDDWDRLRAAHVMAGGGLEEIGKAVLTGLVIQYQTSLEQLTTDDMLSPKERVDLLASLSDAFTKAVAANKRILPEISELAVALEVIKQLGHFVTEHYPQHRVAFLEILEPFGERMEKYYS
jgi:DNA-binding PucR family transcriptional regulator